MPTSYAMKKEFTPILALMIVFLVLVISALLYASIYADFELIMLIFLFIALVAFIVMVAAWYNKMDTTTKHTVEDHRLQ